MADYHEIAPSPRLAQHVECFWRLRASPTESAHRVLPDGCTDLLFSIQTSASAVGLMTRPTLTPVKPGQELFGVRFHPGMSYGLLRVPIEELTNQVADLETLWGNDGKILAERFLNATSDAGRIAAVEAALEARDHRTPVQSAALWVVENRGEVNADDLARHAGLSARQFRRLCIEQTGVGPKMLCRIVRFRNAAGRIVHPPSNWADFALEHGYYDQAHFINEFRELSGLTPAQYVAVFSNTPTQPQP